MKREIITCDYCRKDCSERHYIIFCEGNGKIIYRRDVCPDCFNPPREGEDHADN